MLNALNVDWASKNIATILYLHTRTSNAILNYDDLNLEYYRVFTEDFLSTTARTVYIRSIKSFQYLFLFKRFSHFFKFKLQTFVINKIYLNS